MLYSTSPHLYTSAYELAEVNDPAEGAAGAAGVSRSRGRVTASRSNSLLFTGPYRPPTLFGTVAAVGFFGMSMGFTLSICSFIVFSTSRFWASALGRGGLVLLILGSLLLAISVLHHFCKAATRKLLLKRLETARSLGRVCCRSLRAACCPVALSARGGGNAAGILDDISRLDYDDPGADELVDGDSPSCCVDVSREGLLMAADGAQMLLSGSQDRQSDEADMQLGDVRVPGPAAATDVDRPSEEASLAATEANGAAHGKACLME